MEKTVKPSTVKVYDYTIQALAFLSATLAVSVKIVGLFCHGPESRLLVFRAKDRESKFEANFQLGLLTSMYTSSGHATPASMLSAFSAIIVISKTGVQNLMQKHGKKLSETSVLGKICVAASALPPRECFKDRIPLVHPYLERNDLASSRHLLNRPCQPCPYHPKDAKSIPRNDVYFSEPKRDVRQSRNASLAKKPRWKTDRIGHDSPDFRPHWRSWDIPNREP